MSKLGGAVGGAVGAGVGTGVGIGVDASVGLPVGVDVGEVEVVLLFGVVGVGLLSAPPTAKGVEVCGGV